MKNQHSFGSAIEALVYPILLIAVLWVVNWAEIELDMNLISWGIRPQDWDSWKGLFMMPLLHSPYELAHIINNSIPLMVLMAALIYYYRVVAFRVIAFAWIGTGLSIWLLAHDSGAYHIGMSGVIYALFGFLFISGFLRKFKPLQSLSLFVVFLYGSLIWGIFPQQQSVSWEGHFAGFAIGVFLAIRYRKLGPIAPKYQYEIEKELGIEPPDFEGEYHRKIELLEQQRLNKELESQVNYVYHFIPKQPPFSEEKPPGDNAS